MDYKLIRQLLDKYFEGNTSLEEEAQLIAFFRQNNSLPEDLQAYAPWFGYLEDQKAITSSGALPLMNVRQSPRPLWVTVKAFSRVAAIVLIGFMGFKMLSPANQDMKAEKTAAIDWSKYEPKSPEEAFRLTSDALKHTSSELNRGALKAAKEVFKMKHQQ